MSNLLESTDKSMWIPLYGQKTGSKDEITNQTIGKINVETNFLENSYRGDSDDSLGEDIKDLELRHARKVAAVLEKSEKYKRERGNSDDLNLIDDKKLHSRAYWNQQQAASQQYVQKSKNHRKLN